MTNHAYKRLVQHSVYCVYKLEKIFSEYKAEE